jgi:hypothetical protein
MVWEIARTREIARYTQFKGRFFSSLNKKIKNKKERKENRVPWGSFSFHSRE